MKRKVIEREREKERKKLRSAFTDKKSIEIEVREKKVHMKTDIFFQPTHSNRTNYR